jgi:FAD/FMN-containing dehydrogenase
MCAGVGGLTVGGGYGWLSPKYGLTIDVLEAAEVVLANGEIVRCSEKENADLFWAIRGTLSRSFLPLPAVLIFFLNT